MYCCLVKGQISISLELIISILALVISVGCACFEYAWNRKINNINLKSTIAKDIYQDYLLHKIPVSRKAILYNNRTVTCADSLIDTLNDMRRASLFYKYTDKTFYEKLVNYLQKLEDILVKNTDKKMEDEEYFKFVEEINKDIEKIYKNVMKKFIDG